MDEEQAVLRITSDRMKTRTPGEVDHLVPLFGPMLDLLERMAKVSGGEEFVSPGRKRGGAGKAPQQLRSEQPPDRSGIQRPPPGTWDAINRQDAGSGGRRFPGPDLWSERGLEDAGQDSGDL